MGEIRLSVFPDGFLVNSSSVSLTQQCDIQSYLVHFTAPLAPPVSKVAEARREAFCNLVPFPVPGESLRTLDGHDAG